MVFWEFGMFVTEIGEADYLFAVFSTIAANLENGKFGSRFPAITGELAAGKLPYEHLEKAKAEVAQIHEELKGIPYTQVVWDIDDPTIPPAWNGDDHEDITDLSNYFVNSDGKDFFEILDWVIDYAMKEKEDLKIFTTADKAVTFFTGEKKNKPKHALFRKLW